MKYYYLDVSLQFDTGSKQQVSSAAFFKKHVLQSLKTLFGEVAASITVDILKYNGDPCEPRAIIRVPSEYYVKLYSSLTLCGTYEGKACAYRVHKTSPLLISLCGDSRDYEH